MTEESHYWANFWRNYGKDAIGILDGGKPVSDHNSGLSLRLHDLVQRRLNEMLRL